MSHIYKKFVNERASKLVTNLDEIRNCTVIAHIDHGKTTLTDSLIAASGLLSKEVAASARLLDYDLIEQERGITIKASGISLIHEMSEKEYLIHLIDTPGHIDFSSHVTRGLRLTDGALIVVDVIEGIMVQTETVTRQAMEELVKPVLFVNKVDRLIKERRLDAKRVAQEITKTVREFNAMLGKYLDDELLEQWEVSFSRGSLCIGSALGKWGFGIETLLEKTDGKDDTPSLALAFVELLDEVVSAYAEENVKLLQERFPIARVALNALVRIVPPPKKAQQYRIPRFWSTASPEASLLACDPAGTTILSVGEVQPDRHAGTVAAVRIFSGSLKRGGKLRNLRTGEIGKSLQIGLFMSKTRVALPDVPAGNLAFITGLKNIAVGDTLVDEGAADTGFMKGLIYPTEPVVTYTLSPRKLADLGTIEEPIIEYVNTDPALEFEINEETGEFLISGAGELHIEVSVQKLQRRGINLILGEPMVLLREQMSKDGDAIEGGDETTSRFTVRCVISSDELLKSSQTILDSDKPSGCYIIDTTGNINLYSDFIEWIREAFRTIIRYGPLKGERMRKLTVLIEKASVSTESPETSWRDITQPLVATMRGSIESGNPVLLEPWTKLEISTPEEHVGVLTAILARRKGDVLEITLERALFRIEAEIPVRMSFGLAAEIRTSTSGWATWGARSGGFRQVGSGKPYY